MKKVVFGVIMVLLSYSNVFGQETIGCKLEVEWVSEDTVAFIFTYYLECGMNTYHPEIEINAGKYYDLIQKGVVSSPIDITPVCKSQCTKCSNSSCSFDFGISEVQVICLWPLEKYRKSNDCLLSLLAAYGYTPKGYSNFGKDVGLGIHSKIDICDGKGINTPKWNNPSTFYECVKEDAKLDVSASVNANGLDIYYKIIEPESFGVQLYENSYKYDKPFYFKGFPKNTSPLPGGFHIDTVLGLIQFRPMRAEQTLFSVQKTAYENGKFVNSTAQTIFLNVEKCPSNSPPVVSGYNCKTPEPQNFTFYTCAEKAICFNVCTSDADTADSVSISYNGNISGATFKITNPGSQRDSGQFCWTPDKSQISNNPYYFSLTVKDNKCPVPASYSQVYKIYVTQNDTADLQMRIDTIDNCGNYKFTLSDKNLKYLHDVEWYLNDTMKFGEGSVVKYNFTTNGNNRITAIYNGCKTQVAQQHLNISGIKPIQLNPVGDTFLCANQLLDLNLHASGGIGALHYNWSFPGGAKNKPFNSDSMGILVSFKNNSTPLNYNFSYTVTDSMGCSQKGSHIVQVKGYQTDETATGTTICSNLDTFIALPDKGVVGWHGAGVIHDTFYNNLAPKGNILLEYRNVEGTQCLVDTATIKSFGAAKIKAGADFGLCASAGDTLLTGIPTGGIWTGNYLSGNTFDPAKAPKGSHELYYSATDSNGCIGSDTLLINVVNYQPNIIIKDTVKACLNEAEAKISGSPAGGVWTATGFRSSTNEIIIKPEDFGAGVHAFTYSYSDSNKCSNSGETQLLVNPLPNIKFHVDSIVKQGDTLSIDNKTQPKAHVQFTWIISAPTDKQATGFQPQIKMDSLGKHNITLIATNQKTGCSDTLSQTDAVEVELNTAIGSGKLSKLHIYPNPVGNTLYFNNQTEIPLSYQLLTIDGKIIKTITESRGLQQMNLNALPAGVYALKITGEGIVEVQQVVKE